MHKIQRSISKKLISDLDRKIVILAGPRQCGKTTFSKSINQTYEYLNYDILEDRSQIIKQEWDRSKDLLILDELHKMPKWKSWLKGMYDKNGVVPQKILVTGSARLDTFKKTGDSLAGRHFYYRLHPFDIKELIECGFNKNPEDILNTMMAVGGYPEPFLMNDIQEYRRWRKGHLDIILKHDLIDLETIRDLQSIQILIEILRSKVGSGISVNSLATDLSKDPKTVQKWLDHLEDLFVIFKLTPYSKDISRSLKKEPKFYFYDTGLIDDNESAKLENIVACALLKEVHRLSDAEGIEFKLQYLKVKGGREIDFVIVPTEKSRFATLVEVKTSETDASPNFKLFSPFFKNSKKIQVVMNLSKKFTTASGIEVRNVSEWLSEFKLIE